MAKGFSTLDKNDKNSLLQGGFASQAFSKKKKGIFQDQILNVHIFFLLVG